MVNCVVSPKEFVQSRGGSVKEEGYDKGGGSYLVSIGKGGKQETTYIGEVSSPGGAFDERNREEEGEVNLQEKEETKIKEG